MVNKDGLSEDINQEINQNKDVNKDILESVNLIKDAVEIGTHTSNNINSNLNIESMLSNKEVNIEVGKEVNNNKPKILNVAGLPIAVFINAMYITLSFFALIFEVGSMALMSLSVLYVTYVVFYIVLAIKRKQFRYIGFIVLSIPVGIMAAVFTLFLICGGMILTM